jgi:hypothetical protein
LPIPLLLFIVGALESLSILKFYREENSHENAIKKRLKYFALSSQARLILMIMREWTIQWLLKLIHFKSAENREI